MAAFNREELSRCSKAELLDYIEQQQDQLSRFETRFRGGGRSAHSNAISYGGRGSPIFTTGGQYLSPLRTSSLQICTCMF